MRGFCALLLWQRQLPVRRVDLSTDALAHAFFHKGMCHEAFFNRGLKVYAVFVQPVLEITISDL